MKRILLLTVTLILLAFCNGNTLSNRIYSDLSVNDLQTDSYETMEALGSQVFKFIQTNNLDKILTLVPNADEWKAEIMKSALPESKKIMTVSKNVNYWITESIASLNETYSNFKQSSDSDGIDWSNYSIDYLDYRHTNKYNMQQADIYLYVSFDEEQYKISLNDCIKTGQSWHIGNEISWKRLK
ncbi:MAG: hypothetical protein ACE5EE_02890 [Fidelibacterota bacterium]